MHHPTPPILETHPLKADLPSIRELLENPDKARAFFEDIRPCENSEEVRDALRRLISDESLFQLLKRQGFPKTPKWMDALFIRPAIRAYLRFKSRNVRSVLGMQSLEKPYIRRMVKKTITRLSFDQSEALLQPATHSLFISNHRDIATDPTLILYTLHLSDETRRLPFLATGDNLFHPEFVGNLLRLNGSFKVKRSVGRRDLFFTLHQLSLHIRYLLSHGSVWIAQRQGRAKDGNDKTDRSLLGMLTASFGDTPLHQSLNNLAIIPVSLSYEYDPCDTLKARELARLESHGSYQKKGFEDLRQVVTGLSGFKGRVHITFGQKLHFEEGTDKESAAEKIDRAIHQGVKLMPTHLCAYRMLKDKAGEPLHPRFSLEEKHWGQSELTTAAEKLETRARALPERAREAFFQAYALPAINRFEALDALER